MNTISNELLPVIFLGLMGFAMLLYAILDGYDLGTGILIAGRQEQHRDMMIASIGPFWDANETWLVLGVGILLVAFPMAHGLILTALYVPVAVMLAGLILRGVSFDFRAKVQTTQKRTWDIAFFAGSLLATLSQGYMLGLYITGFSTTPAAVLFALLSALCVTSAYVLIGACWLIHKTEGELQLYAIRSARKAVALTAIGLLSVSIANPLVSEDIMGKWFGFPKTLYLAPLPLLTITLLIILYRLLGNFQQRQGRRDAWPLLLTVGIFLLSFIGLAYSFYPMVVPGKLTVWEAASAPESLRVILWGCIVVLPAILTYTVLSYYIFRGKTTALSYY